MEKALWDKVQSVLAENRVHRFTRVDAKDPSLLTGLVFDKSGEQLTPTHAVKKGTRYRYYVSKSLITGSAKDHSQGRRIPAGDLESLVVGRLRTFLADESAILSAIRNAEQTGAEQQRLIAHGRQVSEDVPTLAQDMVRSILLTIVSRVAIKAECVEISVCRQKLRDLLRAPSIEKTSPAPASAHHPGDVVELTVKTRRVSAFQFPDLRRLCGRLLYCRYLFSAHLRRRPCAERDWTSYRLPADRETTLSGDSICRKSELGYSRRRRPPYGEKADCET